MPCSPARGNRRLLRQILRRMDPSNANKKERNAGKDWGVDLGTVGEDDVGVAGVGERVGDGEVVSPHHADAELPDHMLRRHGAGFSSDKILACWRARGGN